MKHFSPSVSFSKYYSSICAKVFLSIKFILSFCIPDYAFAREEVSDFLAVARAKYDTPFTKEYRKRYEANSINPAMVIAFASDKFKKTYSDADKVNIKKLTVYLIDYINRAINLKYPPMQAIAWV